MTKLMLVVGLVALLAGVVYATNPFPYETPRTDAKTWHFKVKNDGSPFKNWQKWNSYWGGHETHTAWLDHGVGSWLLFDYLKHHRKQSTRKALLEAFALGVAWEIKDGFFPYERWGKWGGDGFSYKDLMRDATGLATGYLFNYITEKRTRKVAARKK